MINVENLTSDYVVGSLKFTPAHWTNPISSDWYPHCFVHKSGWIVVYYLRQNVQNPGTTGWLGKIVDWVQYVNSGKLTDNFLSEGIYYMATSTLALPASASVRAQYFDFQYPDATNLLFTVKHAPDNTLQSFNIKIPSSSIISERSWSCYSTGAGYTFKIDANQISADSGWHYGGPEITDTILSTDYWHTVWISCGYNYYGSDAYVCLLLLYS